ncbi:mucin-13 isoform X4 [Microcaecilia unicolor]|uniref:Mucin-13 isoform X4 n=1 Tax=Microcaecilia unicolor TaxID=1415580 RepID=A0A6P7YG35_9AMPH|nr:mucin-13 isoform X4 [Microcaecilia unicolor]
MRSSIVLLLLCNLVFCNLQDAQANTTTSDSTATASSPGSTSAMISTATSETTISGSTSAMISTATSPPKTSGSTSAMISTATSQTTISGSTSAMISTATSPPKTSGPDSKTNGTTAPPTSKPGPDSKTNGTTAPPTSKPGPDSKTNGTTAPPTTRPEPSFNTSSNETATITNPVPSKPCDENPCGTNVATCINTAEKFICKCPFAFFFNLAGKSCDLGKSFYGRLTLNIPYSSALQDTSSPEFQAVYDKVTVFFEKCFNGTISNTTISGYEQTVISEIQQTASTRTWKAGAGTLVKVINMFRENSNAKEEIVRNAINKGTESDSYFSGFSTSDVCEENLYCNLTTTNCINNNATFPTCNCKEGYWPNAPVVTTCKACEPDCGVKDTMTYCQIQDIPVCKCQPNHFNNSGTCEPCSFGYSGEDCKDSALLIVVIVIAVCGAIMLALIGAVIGISLKSKKSKNQERRHLLSNEEPADASNTRGPFFFPKVQTNSGAEGNRSASNPYEEDSQFKRHMPKRDYDDEGPWYEMANNKTATQSRF